jgi:hypothetical protein
MLQAAPTTPTQTSIIIAPPINVLHVTSEDETLFIVLAFIITVTIHLEQKGLSYSNICSKTHLMDVRNSSHHTPLNIIYTSAYLSVEPIFLYHAEMPRR